jgi:eukaryotic-like serine/threonine-protein kinase
MAHMTATPTDDHVRAAMDGETSIDFAATIVPGQVYEPLHGAWGSIPRLLGLELGEKIGEGGMGVVLVGRQEPLGREVAVKRVRPGAPAHAERSLLAEARITGCLEHPNVIPVHTVGLGGDDEDVLSLVMKRVDGVNLAALLDDPNHPGWELATGFRLAWLIEVLCQVCRALQFAHSRGIVHRDVKPENIMVGAFGEVYLLDWGIAVPAGAEAAAGADPNGLGIVGTPSYMAPELTGHEFGEVTPATDVYLLGATLHECVTGRPRHSGRSLMHLVQSARMSEPQVYASDVPRELSGICNRAMARDPEDRFKSAEGLRRALASYLSNRPLRDFCACSLQQLAQLENDLSRGDVSAVELHRTFGACRLGFREVLRGIPNDVEALRGLQRALHLMIEFELSREHPEAAQLLLSELPGEHPEFRERIAAQIVNRDARKRELERLRVVEAEHDLTVGGVSRAVFFFGLGVLISALLAAMGVVREVEGMLPSVPHMLVGAVVILAAGVAVTYLLRRQLLANRASASIIFTLLAGVVGVVSSRALNYVQGEQDVLALLDRDHLLFTFVLVTLGITVDRRVLVATPIWVAGLLVSFAFPRWSLFIVASAALLGFSAIAALMARGRPRADLRDGDRAEAQTIAGSEP